MSSLPGNPAALAERADAYINAAKLIDQAAADLRRLAFESRSRAVDKLQTKSSEVAHELDEAHGRYYGTAHALKEYAVTLQHLHDEVDHAEEDRARANSQHARTEYDSTRAEHQLKRAEADPATPTSVIQQLQHTVEQYERQASHQQAAADAAQARIAQASKELNEAAERAKAKIDTAIKGTNEGFWDSVKKFVEDVGDFFASVGKWATDFLKTVVDGLIKVVQAVLKVLLITLLIIVGIAVLAVLLARLILTAPVTIPLIVLALLTTDMLQRRRLLLAALTMLVPEVSAFVMWRMWHSANAPVNDPEEVSPGAHENPVGSTVGGEGKDLAMLDRARVVDEASDADHSMVDVEIIRDPVTGEQRAVVTLSSTLDWQYLSTLIPHGAAGPFAPDKHGVGDFDSNLLLQMHPELAGQYERAVKKALDAAHLPPGIPIALTGFSQGGIMAQQIASNNSGLWSGYNFRDVFAFGCPTDGPSRNPNVNTIVVQDPSEPVPQTSGDFFHQVTSGDRLEIVRVPGNGQHSIKDNYDDALNSLKSSSDPAARAQYADLIARSQRYAGTVESHRRFSLSE